MKTSKRTGRRLAPVTLLAQKIVRVLNEWSEYPPTADEDILWIRKRYDELKYKNSFSEAANQAQVEWIMRQLR
jgi:hypothetical protein